MKRWLLLVGLIFFACGTGLFVLVMVKSPIQPITAPLPSQSPLASPQTNTKTISGFVIPHHDLVKAQRAETFKKVANQINQPKTIILISPNHYESGRADIQTTDQSWTTTLGDIQPNKTVIQSLQNAQVAGSEPSSFLNEHGIKLILGDIKQNFPNATLVPIIFKIKTPETEITALHDTLKQNCNDCLLIASVDFSHYQPAILANLHDDTSIRALENLDTSLILSRVEVDSPPALTLLIDWAKSHNTRHFMLDNHTNSGVLVNDLTGQTTTHVFGWYETGEPTTPPNQVNFLLGGDMMFGRSIAHTFLAGGLEKSVDQLGDRLFWGTDAGIVNLEGPVSSTPVPDNTNPNNLVFNFPPQAIDVLKYMHVNAASQANNHSGNQGAQGLVTTRDLLTKASIQGIGGPSGDDTVKVATFTGQNLTLKVIGVLTLSGTPDITPLIKQFKQDPQTRVLIFPHWGNEYKYNHYPNQEHDAHTWIDAGADAIIGAHPHVIEDSELYKGKPILYSVGNLLFDQDFSVETQQELVIGGSFTDDGLHLFALPVQSTKYKPALMKDGDTRNQILQKLYAPFAANKQSSPAGDLLFFAKQ